MTTIQVKVPATTANIGAGFDCLGAALTLNNTFRFTPTDAEAKPFSLEVTGAAVEANKLDADPDNLLYVAFKYLYEKIGQPIPNIHIAIDLNVPLSRGLGSSATAIVGGLVGANTLAGSPLKEPEVMQLAIELEGHPDNVVPALLGGCQLSVNHQQKWVICPWAWHKAVIPVVAIPDFELSTEESRLVLPQQYARAQAIFNASRLGLLPHGLAQNHPDYLRASLDDQIHQPYRKNLIVGYDQVQQAAIDAGAFGMVISGAGPTLLALTPPDNAEQVAQSMATAWAKFKINAQTKVLAIASEGTTVQKI
ncbi:homoserine kinase [[Limnothrix rosea] IAM M-220]|uniref:homoserine kinase n=1 Tax=[Limnothrix rosea] IAM M-220 TaxID=454133 RepID=UPI00095B327E|nr:homoserine kinase [[Limnothrix rosea] IAM M-220]OKH17603.1 homoserine kinase [[Limnothrix rosea] IAM M-220]